MTIQTVSFEAKGGGEVKGELSLPEGDGRGPAVVLIQEWWGVNDHIRSLLRRLSAAGFVALAPDLYHGKITKDANEAGQLMAALDTLVAVREIDDAAAFLRGHGRGNGKVGVMGFCLGGALSFASACHVEGLGAVVPFYGIPPAEKVDYSKATAPILTHVGSRDTWVTPDRARDVKKQIDGHGKTSVQLEIYEADHAFANDTRPEVYSAEAASIAWTRSIDFLRKHLG